MTEKCRAQLNQRSSKLLSSAENTVWPLVPPIKSLNLSYRLHQYLSGCAFCCCDEHLDQKQPGRGRVYFTLQLIVHHGEKLQWEPEGGIEAEASEGCCLLACLPWLAQSALMRNPGPPARGWYHPQWAVPLTSTVNQENAPMDLPRGQSDGGIFLIAVPSSQMTAAASCVELTRI